MSLQQRNIHSLIYVILIFSDNSQEIRDSIRYSFCFYHLVTLSIIKINSISLGTTLFSRYNFPLHHLISLIKLLPGSLPSVMRP
ncbi:Uncharacterised protein [Segatella copri]|nr:Uncharacterised protein [Segatella copri]